MPKAASRRLSALLDERARVLAEFARREHAGAADPTNAEVDQYGEAIAELDREIFGQPHADAPSVDLALRARVAMEYLPIPPDEPGAASELEILAVRALRSSLRLLAVRGKPRRRR